MLPFQTAEISFLQVLRQRKIKHALCDLLLRRLHTTPLCSLAQVEASSSAVVWDAVTSSSQKNAGPSSVKSIMQTR